MQQIFCSMTRRSELSPSSRISISVALVFKGDIPKNALYWDKFWSWFAISPFSFSKDLNSSSIRLRSNQTHPLSSYVILSFRSRSFTYFHNSSIVSSLFDIISSIYLCSYFYASFCFWSYDSSCTSSSIRKSLAYKSCFSLFLSFCSSNISFSSRSRSSNKSITRSQLDFTESFNESMESFDQFSILDISYRWNTHSWNRFSR